jgi:hypothetical protein
MLDPAPEEEKKVGQALVVYSPFHNNTSVVFKSLVVYKKPFETFDLEVSFDVPGRKVVRPEAVRFALRSDDKRSVLKTARQFTIKAYGKTFDLSQVTTKSDSFLDEPEQFIFGNLSFADFEQVAKSERADIKVGSITFSLMEPHLEGLRDMLKAVEAN